MANNTVQDRTILAGLSRLRASGQGAITWLIGGSKQATAGAITNVNFSTGVTAIVVGNTLNLTVAGGGGGLTLPQARAVIALRAF